MRAMILAPTICAAACAHAPVTETPTMETQEAIQRAANDFAAAWSSGDPDAAASFFTEDAVRVDAAGGIQNGRAEIRAALDELVHRILSVPKIAFGSGTIRMITADCALWRGDMNITTADGAMLKGYATLLMRREDGRWLILEAHPKLYPPPK
jgi:uncharacterized protein (TIGR02246 family)